MVAPSSATSSTSPSKKRTPFGNNLKKLSGGNSIRAFWAQPDPPDFTWRLMAYFGVARLLIAAAILFYFGYRTGLNLSPRTQTQIFLIGAPYLLVALLGFVLPLFSRKHFYVHLTLRLTFDVVCLSCFFLMLESSRAGLAILFLLPVLGAAVLGTVTAALFAAAISSLVILSVPFRAIAEHSTGDIGLLQAGLYGLAFMATALLMRMLAQRQIAQEVLAADREYELHLQQAINRLMVLDMQDGVMLARSDGSVIAINPAAGALIGLAATGVWAGTESQMNKAMIAPNLKQLIHLRPLLEAMRRWMRVRDEAPRMIEIERPATHTTRDERGREHDTSISAARVRLRARFVHPSLEGQESSLSLLTTRMPYLEEQTRNFAFAEQAQLRKQREEDLPEALREALRDTVLIYLESWEKITEQTQQEKLAAMGRLVASIAHEVRNPLAAISHASELLAEEIHQAAPYQSPPVVGASGALMPMRMLQIIGDNVKRLDRIVSDVLLLSRRPRTESAPILLQKELSDIVEQWRRNAALTNPNQEQYMQRKLQDTINANLVRVNAENMPPARFDTAHLQQILFNLLDNAKRYCRNLPGSIVVSAYVLDEFHAELMIWNDGPEIPPEIERSLFEPFFTSEMQGTGLGLYLARELCYANQAHIRYASARRERLQAALSPLGLFGQDKISHRAFLITMRLDRSS